MTEKQINSVKKFAADSGNTALVATCERALLGSQQAIRFIQACFGDLVKN